MGWTMEPQKKRKKIVIGVLAVSIVTLILCLGLGLGLDLQKCRNKVVPHTSCRDRCFQPYGEEPGCRCDDSCVSSNSCCYDFHDTCSVPAQMWECTKLRCGETRLNQSRCHCSDDCVSAHDCCTNYKHVCHGEKTWLEEECDVQMSPTCPLNFRTQPLLLVSLDGLRAEYLQTWRSLVPVLDKLRACGTSAPYMQSAFPTKTFPNHYTIVTGLYPESNGLIDNVMYDPVFDASFSLSNSEKDNPAWYLGQPVWHTARYQGLRSGTFFWPGSDVKVNGSFPDIYRPYSGKVPFEERVFTVLKWLQLPDDERPHFFTLYLEEPDKSGHSYGPVSGGVIDALMGVDKVIGQLMNGLKQLGLHRCLNIIIVADHGMEDTSCDRKEVLQELVGDVSSYWVTEGPFGRIRAKNKDTVIDPAELVANMTCKKPDQKIKPYLKTNLPKRLHFANSRRIEDVNVLVDAKWLFERSPGSLTFCSGGAHGYDNDVESMHAMFVSYGPKFQSKTEVEPFSNIELYNLMCDLLQISPADNNGTHGSLNHMLRTPFYKPAPPAEQSRPAQCQLLSLDPEDTLACSCPALSGNEINSRLNLTTEQESAAEMKHLLFGRPRTLQSDRSYCLLRHDGFISAYSSDALMPLWSSFTIDKPVTTDPLVPVTQKCLRADVRLLTTQSPRCDEYDRAGNLTHAFLYPPNLNTTAEQQFDALLTSNVVPMYPEFKKIWTYFHDTLLMKYASVYNGVNVVTGPAFDYNYDGQYDRPEQIQQFVSGTNISIPTHYFVVLTSCRNSTQTASACGSELQTVSFLLPHRPDNSHSCRSSGDESEWVDDLMWFHRSRVRDVEWITGLDFYQGSSRPIEELLRMKTRPTAAIQRKH
ncbi:venom phosphodiesterase 1-like [Solea senegalensis]|uniref:Venom phosphodiesterase 1-like n=2 Tax=Solea senegalensis TaxID=28829 RepID=A0AAV6PFY9_SOLSE|nr:ectonucleotide pyrophosphatase/phosphodiesterase family member 3 isoform X1 [Solea senegalensis]KAG7460455.1 venom phosphodiesterase 1-like [Solea senegalensis]